jgi:hypothetical protein
MGHLIQPGHDPGPDIEAPLRGLRWVLANGYRLSTGIRIIKTGKPPALLGDSQEFDNYGNI